MIVGPIRPPSKRADCSSARARPVRCDDRSALDYLRVFASRAGVIGMPIGGLKIPGGFDYSYIQVRRGDADLLPDTELVLEFGDRVGVLSHRENFPALRRFFGDSIKGAADFSYITLGVGAALGLLVGMIPDSGPRDRAGSRSGCRASCWWALLSVTCGAPGDWCGRCRSRPTLC
jgi:putative transport protein